MSKTHSGSIARSTQEGEVYRALHGDWRSIGWIQSDLWINSGSAVLSSIYKQLPRYEVIVKRYKYGYWEFHWFKSKTAARKALKGVKYRWTWGGE